MLPASTSSPPYFLTPRRFECESRPLRVLPPAFLCAMRESPQIPLRDDLRDLHIGIGLPMGLFALVMLASLEFDDAHLVALAVTLHSRNHFGVADVGGADPDIGSGAD